MLFSMMHMGCSFAGVQLGGAVSKPKIDWNDNANAEGFRNDIEG
jgi:hypothetical protein